MEPVTRNVLVAALIFSFALPSSLGATDNPPRDEAETLRAENAALSNTVNRLNKENEALKAEVERLRAHLEKASTDARSPPSASPRQGEQSIKTAQDSTKDGNKAVAAAINEYTEALRNLEADTSLTDIQRRTKWMEVTQRLDRVLHANRVLVSYVIKDVHFDAATATAILYCSSAHIKPSDPKAIEVVLRGFYAARIAATEAEALKITDGSAMTVAGCLALNVDFSKPAASQPTLYLVNNMPGYRLLGEVHGLSDEVRLLDFSFSCTDPYWGRVPGRLTLMIGEDCVVTVDGVRRILSRGDKAKNVRVPPKPSLPFPNRVEPGVARPSG
jgi:cell division protein FtsB